MLLHNATVSHFHSNDSASLLPALQACFLPEYYLLSLKILGSFESGCVDHIHLYITHILLTLEPTNQKTGEQTLSPGGGVRTDGVQRTGWVGGGQWMLMQQTTSQQCYCQTTSKYKDSDPLIAASQTRQTTKLWLVAQTDHPTPKWIIPSESGHRCNCSMTRCHLVLVHLGDLSTRRYSVGPDVIQYCVLLRVANSVLTCSTFLSNKSGFW